MDNKIVFNNSIVSRILLLSCIMFAFLFINAAFNATPAQAASCAALTPCISTEIALVVNGGSNGTGGVGMGGGTGSPGTPAKDCRNVALVTTGTTELLCANTFKTSDNWIGFEDGIKDTMIISGLPYFGCSVKNINGFTVAPEGVILLVPFKFDHFTEYGVPYYIQQATKEVCVYPQSVTSVSPWKKCILSYSAAFDRSANSRLGYAGRVKNISQTITTKDDILQNPANCKTTYSANVNYSPPTSQNAWGQYTATSKVNYVQCQTGTTSFDGKSTSIAKCQSPQTMNGSTSRLTIWCAGFVPAHVQKSWSASDCYATGAYSCKIPTPATYNGLNGTVQGIRDGKNSTLKWGTPVLSSGIRNSSNWKSLTNVNKGSTPYNTTYSANDKNKQLFFSDNVTFGSWMSGQKLSQNLAFYTAGSTGSPFSMTRSYKYDAQFLVKTAKINTYNITTGAINASNISTWVPDVNVPCGPQGSPNINVIRAIGDKVG